MSTPAPELSVDRRSAIYAASYVVAISMIFINLLPITLGALASDLRFSDNALGQLSAVLTASGAIFTLTAPIWVRRLAWRRLTCGMLLLAALVYAVATQATSVYGVFGVFAAIGLINSVSGAPAFAALGDASNPDRSFGISAIFQSVMAAAITALLSSIILPRAGVPGLFVTLSVIAVSGLLICYALPDRGRASNRDPAAAGGGAKAAPLFSAAAAPGLVVLLAIACYSGALPGFWIYVVRIGGEQGLSPMVMGLTLSATTLATIPSSALVAGLSGRFSNVTFIALGTLILLLAYGLLLAGSLLTFIWANLCFSLAWGMTQPTYWGLLSKVDATNRLFVAAPAVTSIMGIIFGLLAGPIIQMGGFLGLSLASCGLALAGLMIAGLVRQKPAQTRAVAV